MSGELDPQKILDKANAGVPLLPVEIWRMANASGQQVPKARRFRQFAQETEDKFRELLRAELGDELAAMLFEERSIKPRRRVRRVR